MKSESEVAQSCLTLSNPMDCRPTRLQPGNPRLSLKEFIFFQNHDIINARKLKLSPGIISHEFVSTIKVSLAFQNKNE